MRAAFLIVLLCASHAGAETFRVAGTVTAAGSPVGGARVQLGQTTVTTAADGRFSSELPASTINVTVDGPPGHLRTELHGVPIDRETELRLTLQRPVQISGRVAIDGVTQPMLRVESLTRESEYRFGVPPDGQFTLELPPDAYAIHAVAQFPRLHMGRVNVDARNGNVAGADLSMSAVGDQPMQLAPPIASKISVSAADAEGMATVSGSAGATEGLTAVAVANLFTNHFVTTVSHRDGSFSVAIFAPPGAVLEIKHDPLGRFIPKTAGTNNMFEGAAGTLLYVPAAAGTFGITAKTGPLVGVTTPPSVTAAIGAPAIFWLHATGAWTLRDVAPGQSLSLSGTLSLHGKTPIADVAALNVSGGMQPFRYFDAQGRERRAENDFVSGVMTPTGLPIGHSVHPQPFGVMTTTAFTRVGSHYEATFTFEGKAPANLAPGFYRFAPSFSVRGLPELSRSFDVPPSLVTIAEFRPMTLPVVRVGEPSPPRLAWVLGLDDFSNGTRGTIALEDRGSFGIAGHVATNSETFILPMRDDRSGKPIRYRLEPFAPMLSRSAGAGTLAEVPHVPLKFPSGALKVTVTRPDGTVHDLGSAPFAQALLKTPITRAGNTAHGASFHVCDFLQLTTLDPRFEYEFTQYGRHRVSMTGTIEDLDGNVYAGGGTYEVWVAKTLDLETAVLPGTPFEVGDAFTPALVVQPGMPAYIEMHLRDDRGGTRTFSGWANRFGLFTTTDHQRMTSAGEYRVDVTARYLDAAGVLWMGAATWGGVVATPDSPLVTHGRRGFDLVDSAVQPQWFNVPDARAGGDHVMFPFHGGDIMWMSKFDPAADIPKISVQDPVGAFAARVRTRAKAGARWESPYELEDRITIGEIPLFSSVPPSQRDEPENIDQWGYFYAAANRPGVRVRELISGDMSGTGYWRFTGDNYAFQPGTGVQGDLPNDFKLQFGGAVYRDESDGFRYYGGYASLFVLLPDDDRTGRVFPPFQTNGGGPILRLKGKEVDLFFHLTALRPGSILVRGETIPLAGYAAPTLRSRVDFELVSPSGRQRGLSGSTNAFGYFHAPASLVADESGVWRLRVKVTNEGPTSDGPLQPPFPTGDVLGSRDGEMFFYVVDADAPAAVLGAPIQSFPALDRPLDFDLSSTELLTSRELTYTVTSSGYILEEGTTSRSRYTYDLARLAETFPNLDRLDVDGRHAVDTVTLSFFLSGTTANGTRVFRARQLLLQGDELLAPDQSPPPPARRRRSVR